MKKTATFFWQIARFLGFGLGLVGLFFWLAPFARLKPWLDSLASDGSLELFTLKFYSSARPIVLVLGALFFLAGILLTIYRQQSLRKFEDAVNSLYNFPTALRTDRKRFWQKARAYLAQDRDWLVVLALMLIGAFFRVQLLNKPVYHDEAYTYLSFVKGGLGNVISDYHLPNNHIFYSVLVFFSTKLLGNAPWILRLPALLAGLLTIPATYLAGRQYFNRPTAWLSSGIITILPIFMTYGTSARGYALVALFSTLLWFFASLILKEKNRYIWLLFVLTAALGFYSVPIMLYPYTAIMAWLFIAWLFKKHTQDYRREEFFRYLFLSGVLVVTLFFVLYMPVFLKSGISSVINNPTIQQHKESSLSLLTDALRSRSINAWIEWHWAMPAWLGRATLIGAAVALLYRFFGEKKYTDYALISLLTFFGIILAQRSVGWRRVWFFFAPVYFSFAAAGFAYLLKFIFRKKEKWLYGSLMLLFVALTSLTLIWWQSPEPDVRHLRGEASYVERGVLYLADILTPTDAMLIDADYTPQMQYYAEYHGIDIEQTRPANNQFTSLYVMLVVPGEDVAATLHSGTYDRVDLNAQELIYREGNSLKIYKVPIVVFYAE